MSKSLQRERFPQTLYVYTAGDNFNGHRDLDGTDDGETVAVYELVSVNISKVKTSVELEEIA